VTAQARDAGGNAAASGAIEVKIDNTPPAGPVGLAASGGADWSPAASRAVSWSLPPEAGVAPIVTGRLELCRIGGGCIYSDTESTIGHALTLATPGVYEARVSLVDAAGNTDTATAAIATLRYDPEAPGAPTLGTPSQSGRSFIVPVAVSDPGPAPITSLEGVLCEVSGAGCRSVGTTHQTTSFTVTVPGPGTWRLQVAARDAAGNVGSAATRELAVVMPSPSPTVTATPAATPTPPPRTIPRLRFIRARRSGSRLQVIASAPRGVAGTFQLRYRVKVGERTTTLILRRLAARNGRISVSRVLPARMRSARSGRLELRFVGDSRYLARTIARTVRRS